MLGSIFGSPNFGKLPFELCQVSKTWKPPSFESSVLGSWVLGAIQAVHTRAT